MTIGPTEITFVAGDELSGSSGDTGITYTISDSNIQTTAMQVIVQGVYLTPGGAQCIGQY